MPTRNEQKRASITRQIKDVDSKIQPLQRKKAYLQGELKLLDEFEQVELGDAESTLGIDKNPANED